MIVAYWQAGGGREWQSKGRWGKSIKSDRVTVKLCGSVCRSVKGSTVSDDGTWRECEHERVDRRVSWIPRQIFQIEEKKKKRKKNTKKKDGYLIERMCNGSNLMKGWCCHMVFGRLREARVNIYLEWQQAQRDVGLQHQHIHCLGFFIKTGKSSLQMKIFISFYPCGAGDMDCVQCSSRFDGWNGNAMHVYTVLHGAHTRRYIHVKTQINLLKQ